MAIETTDAPQIIEHINHSLNFTPYDTKWIPCSARFVALGMHPRGTGALQVYEMDVGKLKLVHEVRRGAWKVASCRSFSLVVLVVGSLLAG